ncbi:helix-turn-helix domain-containing protein [Endozoicomonas lisbonensis]|uniref:DNA-binding XRE family transcriptional regulator n=1 Tax=Endozoicomonas lisbonensis TaxID=3120522 RepID=A0ABV2SHD0_9GAMM
MTTKDDNEWQPATTNIELTAGESLRIMRELQGLSQQQLADRTGIPHSTIAAIEKDTAGMNIPQAKQLAIALSCHPAVLCFPGWQVTQVNTHSA